MRPTPLVFAAVSVLALQILSAGARATGNAGASAYLAWSATDKTATDLATPGALNGLYVYVERAGGLQFKGGELDLIWSPPGDPGAGCAAHVETFYRTSGGTSCT